MPPIIEVKHLTKEYSLGTLTSAKDTLRHSMAKLRGKETWHREKFKALDDVNFTIERGEVVGIIGHNGAGKSTLLKHIANITKPTRGEITVNGSIAPLIEVGAGVSPDLTGRENIFLNGAILGIPKKTIQRKLDEIIDFSELEQFIDTPVKRYSSGMAIKLGFSIATSLDADILIVDEVLAVGDLAFQRKCFDRMETLINKEGKTVLLVSHNIRQVSRMCSRVILLKQGKIIIDSDPDEACTAFYNENNKQIKSKLISAEQEHNNKVELIDIQIMSPEGLNIEQININDPLNIRIKIRVFSEIIKPEVVIGTHTTDFIYLTANSTDTHETIDNFSPGEYEILFTHQNYPLKPGAYGVRMNVFDQNRNTLFHGENLIFFAVDIDKSESKKPPLRLIDVEGEFRIQKLTK